MSTFSVRSWAGTYNPSGLGGGQRAAAKANPFAVATALSAALKGVGISDYSIFFDEETGDLFGFMKLADDHQLDRLADLEVMKKCWAYNKVIQTCPRRSPVCPRPQ